MHADWSFMVYRFLVNANFVCRVSSVQCFCDADIENEQVFITDQYREGGIL